jgi:hypothetical protein
MSASVHFWLNGGEISLDDPRDEPLLFVLGNRLNLKATHFGCGSEQCGACMVNIDGQEKYSCTFPVSAPGFDLPIVTDNQSDDIEYNRKHGGAGCLGVARRLR